MGFRHVPFYQTAVGMAQTYTVTAGTSIVLISSLQSPNTVVLLSSIQYPGHIVGVRDITGSNEIAQRPVIISTISGLKFYDGTSSVLLNKPNGFISLSSRDASTWQLLNSVGFLTTLSTGFLETLTTQTVFVNTTSSVQGFMSSMTVANVNISKSFEVLGNTNIGGNIQIAGSFNVFSSLHAFQNVSLSSVLEVGGDVSFTSSLFVLDSLTIGSNLSTLQNATIKDNLLVNTNFYGIDVLRPLYMSSLSVQTLRLSSLIVGGGLQLYGGISTLSLSSFSSLIVEGGATFRGEVTVAASTVVQSSFTLDNTLTTSSFISHSSATIHLATDAYTFEGIDGLSTLQFLSVSNHSQIRSFDVEGPLFVKGAAAMDELTVYGSSLVSSVRASSLFLTGSVTSQSSTFLTTTDFNVLSSFLVGGDILAGGRGIPYVTSVFTSNSYISSLNVLDFVSIGKNLNVMSTAFVSGDLRGITNLTVNGTLSTTMFESIDSLIVTGILSVGGTAYVSTLGAPVNLTISTLALSNTLTINYFVKIPSFEVEQYPPKMAAGIDFSQRGAYDLYVDGVLQNSSTVFQTNTVNPLKKWTADTLETSTLSGLSNLSSVLIGSYDFTYPLNPIPYTGLVMGGSNSSGEANLLFASNVSSTFSPCQPASNLTSFYPKRIRFNGSNWVAVGSNSSLGGATVFFSFNGYFWSPASGVNLTQGNDVLYAGGKWIVVGSNLSLGPPTPPTIYTSSDGIVWSGASGSFSNSAYATSIAYNGLNRWIAAGSRGTPLAMAAKWSSNGVTWIDSVANRFNNEEKFTSIVWNGSAFIAYTEYKPMSLKTYVYSSANGCNFSPLTNIDLLDVQYAVYGGEHPFYTGEGYMTVGSELVSNPSTTIAFAGNSSPQSNTTFRVGIFTTSGNDVVYDSNTSNWFAAGTNSDFTNTLGYSHDGVAWQPFAGMSGAAYTISPGTLTTPSNFPYFIPNVTSIFHSTLSSQSITASTVITSSIQGNFFGDGSFITGVTKFGANLDVSSLKVGNTLYANDISTVQTISRRTQVNDSIRVEPTTFFSTATAYIAVGNDDTSIGSVQFSGDGISWTNALTANFDYYGNGIAGNGIGTSPFVVAVGADSRPRYTIQWSRDGLVWNPVVTGGFSNATENGIYEATSVAYKDSVWVAVGVDPQGSNTIQYSSNGSNWTNVSNGFVEYGTTVKASLSTFSPTKFVAIGNGGMKYSSDGETWLTTTFLNPYSFPLPTPIVPTPTITAFGPGTFQRDAVYTGWLAIDTTNSVYYAASVTPNVIYLDSILSGDPFSDILWRSGTDWLGVGGTSVRSSTAITVWPATTILPVITLNTIQYDSEAGTYFIGASSSNTNETIWSSSNNGSSWFALPPGNGFSTVVENYGQGYGITTLGFSTFAVGNSAFSLETSIKPSILNITSTSTQISLTANNASNVFNSVVRGIGATNSEVYNYVAVGDGLLPQKTIARSLDGSPNSWIPAITGGFSTTGYAVTYFQDKWIATGDAQSSRNIIQYSPDGANWFGTNTAVALRSGGRALVANSTTLIVAGGKDTSDKTFAYSSNGFTWSVGTGSYFNRGANGLGFNGAGTYIAVGDDTRGSSNTILRSVNGQSWSLTSATSGLFSTTGYGVAYGNSKWVAVGEDPEPNNTIVYSSDDGLTWTTVTSNGFTGAGYGITFNTSLNRFFAVGKDINGDSPLTIKYSDDAISWNNFTSGGFVSQKSVGSANGILIQPLASTDFVPFMDFSKLVLYDRDTPIIYPQPSIRVSTTYIGFSEGVFVNLSSQVTFGSNTPYESVAVTVGPFGVFVSSLIYTGEPYLSSVSYFSSLILSTLITSPIAQPFLFNPLETPSLAINTVSTQTSNNVINFVRYTNDRANTMTPEIIGELKILTINDGLSVLKSVDGGIKVGSCNRNLDFNYGIDCIVDGSFGTSTLQTVNGNTSSNGNVYISAPRVFYQDGPFSMVGGSDPELVSSENSFYITPSSLTFNSLMTLQVSTQKVGVFTQTPQFELDVQREGILSTVQTNTVNSKLLLFRLQSLQL